MADVGSEIFYDGQDKSNEETRLLEHLRRQESDLKEVFSVHIHLSELRGGNKNPNFIGIAVRSCDQVINNTETVLFRLSNSDIVMVCRSVPVDEVDKAVLTIRSLFREDPLTEAEDGSFEDRFSTWYDLSQMHDFAAFMASVESLVVDARERFGVNKDGSTQSAPVPLGPQNLAEINQRLLETRISDLINEQTAVVVHPGAQGDVLFHEHTVSMAVLSSRVAVNIDLFANPWLFQYLTETLDRRLLSVIAHYDWAKMDHAISINLNITTVLSRDFQLFHRVAAPYAEKIVVELQLIDIFADLEAYARARDSLQGQGYRVLIDGLNPLSLQFFDPADLAPDYVKIAWASEYTGETPEDRVIEMRYVVDRVGRDRVILSRVDSEDAVKWALNIGIRRFQGHYADTIVDAMIEKGII